MEVETVIPMEDSEILTKLQPYANKARAKHDEGYMKTRYSLLGCNMPAIRNVAKAFENTDKKTLNRMWSTSNSFDVLYVLLIILGKKDLTASDWPLLKKWSRKIDNWAHSDTLSEMIARLVELSPDRIYPDLKKWNTSNLPWQRRLSLTSLLYYSAGRKKCLPASKIFPLVKARLDDSDTYVQKAVGWTLREAGNCYPDKARAFIKQHNTRLSPTAFTSATEKWTKKEKEPFKSQRKAARKKA